MSPMQKLLMGSWKSDKRRTLEYCHKYHVLPRARKRRFGALFGKLELRYTRNYVYHNLRGFRYKARYDVVSEDSEGIVIRIHRDELRKKFDPVIAADLEVFFTPKLELIRFRRRRGRQYYWIGLGTFCEWFRKQRV